MNQHVKEWKFNKDLIKADMQILFPGKRNSLKQRNQIFMTYMEV